MIKKLEKYQPTHEDIQRLKLAENMLKISGDQIFATRQGEGVTAGAPAVFLRLHFCNLGCTWCDTGYTWNKKRWEFWKEPVDWAYGETAENISKAWDEKYEIEASGSEKRLVITGGEPLLQQRGIINLVNLLPGWKIEIETNGTIIPMPELQSCQINCSPKLDNSGNSKNRRYKPEVLRAINRLSNSWFKFVVVEPDNLAEIDEIVIECGLNPQKILIMPEGQTAVNVKTHASLVKKQVLARGWTIIARNQLIWYGHKRRT